MFQLFLNQVSIPITQLKFIFDKNYVLELHQLIISLKYF
ncbi:hypothetical protein pb186bvf_008684 [Paramecium bursaria]